MKVFNTKRSIRLKAPEIREVPDGFLIPWEADKLNSTILEISNETKRKGFNGRSNDEIILEEGDELILTIPSGELTGKVEHIDTEKNQVLLKRGWTWKGKWAGFYNGLSGLFYWQAPEHLEAKVMTSLWGLKEKAVGYKIYRETRRIHNLIFEDADFGDPHSKYIHLSQILHWLLSLKSLREKQEEGQLL